MKLDYYTTDEKLEYFYKEGNQKLCSTGNIRFSSLINSWEVEFDHRDEKLWIYNPALSNEVEKLNLRGELKKTE